MDKKLHKIRRRLILRITAVMLSAFVLISVTVSLLLINYNRDKLFYQTTLEYTRVIDSVQLDAETYSNIRAVCESAVSQYSVEQIDYISSEEEDKAEEGDSLVMWLLSMDNTDAVRFKNRQNMQIVVMDMSNSETWSGPPVTDTDDYLGVSFVTLLSEEEKNYFIRGVLSYKSFSQSMTNEQYESISRYLQDSPSEQEIAYRKALQKKAEDPEQYYQLICTEYYLDKWDRILPKTVEIVLTDHTHDWYAQDEVVERYTLSPVLGYVKDKTIHRTSRDTRAVIPKEFFFHTFASGDLQKKYNGQTQIYGDYWGAARLSPFRYLYYNSTQFYVKTVGFAHDSDNTTPENHELRVCFYRDIDLWKASCENILRICFGLFVFFFIVGVILSVTLCHVMKTQMVEEEKRREITRALAHDIKTPLFVISGFARNLRENLYTEKREHYADRIIERTEEVNGIVHRMLNFSKIDEKALTLSKEEFDLCELIRDLVVSFDTMREVREVILDLDEPSPVTADRELIRSALSNLIDNALKYSPDGAKVNITLKDGVFSISNPCENITKSDLKHLCEPYYTKDKSRESRSSGLGLSVAKSIFEMHGMKLDISLKENIITFSVK